jgi:hypothetical protein
MSKFLAAAVALALFLRWLAAASVTVTVDGLPVVLPVLAVTAVPLTAISAAAVALLVYRTRAERATLAAWRARQAMAR